jgi:predicted Zn-dependent protease
VSPERGDLAAEDAANPWRAAGEALDAILRAGGADGEVLLRRSRGTSLRVSRGTPREVSAWDEDGLAVLAILPDGRAALATASRWTGAQEAVTRSIAMARAGGREIEPAPHRMRERPERFGDVPRDPAGEDALATSLGIVESAALATDERVVALDAATARAAVVESYHVSLSGIALHQRHASCLAHASVLARDGLRAATRADAWAGPRLSDGEASAFGERAARSAIVHLTGSGAAPPVLRRLLLAPGALAEITFGFGLALLGAVPLDAAGGAADPRLSLVEDSSLDAFARVVPADGTGRPLRTCAMVEHGAWRVPRPGEIPWVRPGLGDLPRPAWLRLSWQWEGGEDEGALLERMEQGLLVESVHVASVAGGSGRWTGSASGWWVEDGRRRHAVAGVPLTLTIAQIIRGAVSGGKAPVLAHPSGTIRAIPLLVVLEEGDLSRALRP